jgi:hypothetical protein
VPSEPRITANFNYGGRDGDNGVVYLGPDTLIELERAGVELREGMSLTFSDFDGTHDEPTWLVASGVLTKAVESGRKSAEWKLNYPYDERWWAPRSV